LRIKRLTNSRTRHGDFPREAVAMVAAQLMEAEVSAEVGAGLGEVSAARTTHRNGYRPRAWETRVGEIELLIPKKRQGEAYFPSFLEPRRPAEQAIVSVVMEAYVNGVFTGKVDRLVEPLGISAMSKDRVSALCRGLDERVEALRNRPLEGEYPYLRLDAKQLKVRDRGQVRSKALVVAYAVHESGRREVIGIDLGEVESEAFWVDSKLRSTDPLERLNEEIGRRSDVVGIFPNDASAIRLTGPPDREERRVAGLPALPLRGIARPGPRGPGRGAKGGGRATSRLKRPTRSYTTTDDLTAPSPRTE
jgi:transposase-like protein